MNGGQGAKDQVGRLLTLVPMLHSHGQMRLGDAARALGVTPDQLLKDLKVLFLVGLPGGYPDDLIDVDLDPLEGPEGAIDDGMIRVSNADYLARPLRLNPTEASAVIVAMRAMRNGAGDETRPIVDRALAKLEAAAAAGPATTTFDPGADGVDPDALALEDAPASSDRPAATGAADLLRAGPRRGVRPGGRPAWGGRLGRPHLS